MNTKKRALAWARDITYVVSIFAPILLTIYPNSSFRPEERFKVVVSVASFLVLGLVFAVQDIKTFLTERHEQLLNALRSALQQGSIYQSMWKIQESDDALFLKHASSSLDALREDLKQAELGVLRLDESELVTFPIKLASDVEKTLRATAVWNDDPLKKWPEYFDELEKAHRKRGVKIKRLFILLAGDDTSESFKKRLEEEKARGFENRFITLNEWVKTNHVPKPLDFGIWDEGGVWLYTGDKLPSMRHSAEFHKDGNTVRVYQTAFEANWNEATRVR